MWKLTIEDDEGKQTSLPLAHDEYGVGRAEENAIRLTDWNVSRKHAVLKKNGVGWFIQDLTSYNGTYVNGVRVAGEQSVASGDVVQLGDYRLELVDEASAVRTAELPAAPGFAAAVPVHQRPNRLVVVVGPTPGAEFPLDREYFTIGRAEDATISINHSSVSRLHAELIALGNGRYEIVDKQSANGIRINGVELKRGILEAGDALELGDVRLRFVGAGKIFRAGFDQTQQLAVVGGFESVAPSVRAPGFGGGSRGPGLAKFVGLGILVGAIVIAVAFFGMRTTVKPADRPVSSGAPATSDAGFELLRQAKELASTDLEGAHKKLQDIGENSRAREDPSFKEIEGKWADSVFEKEEALSDPIEQRRLLQLIISAPVDPERRTKAWTMIQQLPEPTTAEPLPSHWSPSPGYVPPRDTTSAAQPTASAVKSAEPAVNSTPPSDGAMDNATTRARLLPRLSSGKITKSEAIMLKAACRALGDAVCRDAAAREIAKKSAAP